MRLFLIVLLNVQLLLACSSKQALCIGFGKAFPKPCKFADDDESDTYESPGGEEANEAEPEARTAPDLALVRLTPEQIANSLRQAVGFGEEYDFDDPIAGQRVDGLLTQFSLALGGVDFVGVSRRDPATKAQTLLVARVIAWTFAKGAVDKDLAKPVAARSLFTKCRLEVDRPELSKDSAAAWENQLGELYWRIYGRAPAPSEIAAVRQSFSDVHKLEGTTTAAWTAVIYSLLSSEEFWHL